MLELRAEVSDTHQRTGANDKTGRSMQQLPLTGETDSRKLVEALYDFLAIVVRGWRLVAACVALTMTGAVIYLASAKPAYQAVARLLILQQGGQPVNVAGNGHNQNVLLQSVDGYSNTLASHIMIIRSPLIVSRALDLTNLKGVSAEEVLLGLTVKLPDPAARVIELGYKGGSRDEAVKVVDSVIKSYGRFLTENYQKNSNQVLDLITKARDELNTDLKRLETEYLEHRQKNTGHPVGGDGKTFIAKRLDQWDDAISQATLRSLNLKSQLELGRNLANDGAGIDVITSALSHAGGVPLQPAPATEKAVGTGVSYDRVEAQLREIIFQRQNAESLLYHLRAERAKAVAETKVGEAEVVHEFYAIPEVAERGKAYKHALDSLNETKRTARQANDPSLLLAKTRVNDLEADLGRAWEQMRPEIEAKLAQGDVDHIRQAERELVLLKANEASLRERLDALKEQRLVELEATQARLAKQHGPEHAKVLEVRKQVALLKGGADLTSSDPSQTHSRAPPQVDRGRPEVSRGDQSGARAAVPARPRRIESV